MNADRSCRLTAAARFHLAADWSRRLSLGTPWRAATAEELAVLVRDPAGGGGTDGDVQLFGLPRHLLDDWHELLERAADGAAGPLAHFDAFAGRVAAFLSFKGLPVPPGAAFEAVVIAPGQESVSWAGPEGAGLWGGVNLGEEASAVVFARLPGPAAPPVRLSLEPGEGFCLPDPGPRVTGCTLGNEGPDLLLLIRRGASGPPVSVTPPA